MQIDIEQIIRRGEKEIVLQPGRYRINKTITIVNKDDVSIRSSTGNCSDVEIVFQDGMDGIVVKNSDYFSLEGVTVTLNDTHTKEYQGVVLIMEECNYFNISGCIFNATQRGYGFGIFLAGPKVWSDQDMYDINKDGFENDDDRIAIVSKNTLSMYKRNKLMKYNIFKNNVLNCRSKHDGFSFSLQYGSQMIENTINGTRVAVYMVKKCDVIDNTIEDSLVEGIYISTPSRSLHLCSNTVDRPKGNGIVIDEQLEHSDNKVEHSINNNYKISICKNDVLLNEPNRIGIVLKGCKNIKVKRNTIYSPKGIGILTKGIVARVDDYGNRVYDPSCSHNKIVQNFINLHFDDKDQRESCIVNDELKHPAIYITEYSNNNRIMDNSIMYGSHISSKKIRFYEVVNRYVLVNGVKVLDPQNRYPVNNYDNVISYNRFYTENLNITINDCMEINPTIMENNTIELNETVNLQDTKDWILS